MSKDVIVIGAGLAGLTAARLLKRAGSRVTVLEANGRAGGRSLFRPFKNSADGLDFGGAWITPWQHRIRSLCAQHGIALRPRHPVTDRRWFHTGALHRTSPVPPDQQQAHDAALAAIARDAKALKRGAAVGRESIKDYLDSIAAPAATRDLVSAWWTVSGNGDKTRVPAAEFLASASYHDGSPDGMCEVWAETLEGGVQTLCERMIAAEGIDVRFHHPVAAIAQNGASATITCASGQTFQAHDAVLATGLNPMAGITFSPPLSGVKAEGRSAGHLGRCVKVWAKLTGVAPGILATGGGTGIEWMFTERRTSDGAAFAVGFGVAANGWVPDFPRDVEQASARFFPEARLLDWDWHDWAGDPFARGAWVAGIVGQDGLNAAESWQPEPHLTFASSDIAASEAGWFEAAIISGQDAARASAAKLRIDLLTEL